MFNILERAKQFAKEATNYISSIVGGGNEVKPAQSSNKNLPNSVHYTKNQTVDTPEDKFVKSPEKSDNKKTEKTVTKSVKNYTESDIIKVGTEIDNLKKKFNISDEEYYGIILKRVGYSKQEFLKLSNNEKMAVLLTIKGAMKLFSRDKYINNPNVNSAKLVGDAIDDFEMAKNVGKIKTIDEFDKVTKPYVSKINKEFDEAKTADEKIEVLITNRLKFENDIKNQREAELKLCKTNEERAAVNEKYDGRIKAFEGYFQSKFIAQNGKPENAFISTHLRKADDMVNGYERAVESFSAEARCCAAGTFTHNNRIKQAQRYSEMSDPISASVYGEATKVVTQYMKKADLDKYEADAYAFKKEYYKNPEKYSFITEEHLTQESVGLAMGATLNNNLTASEKAAFLRTWDEHAKEFSDYDEVRGKYYTKLQQYLEKHPEAKQGIEDIKKKYYEQYGEPLKVPYSAKKRYDNRIEESKTEPQAKAESSVRTSKATRQELEQALSSGSFEQVRRQYSKNTDKDFAEVVLKTPKLKNYKYHIVNCLKTLTADDLSDITRGCSTEMFLFVLRNISPNKAGRLYDLSKDEKCYAARKLGEYIVEESKVNEAA